MAYWISNTDFLIVENIFPLHNRNSLLKFQNLMKTNFLPEFLEGKRTIFNSYNRIESKPFVSLNL